MDPAKTGAMLLDHLFDAIHHGGLRTAFGTIAAKNATINLLPLPIVNGGLALWALFGGPTKISPKIERVLTFVLLPIFLGFVAWAIAMCVALRRPPA
jgi:hypothetical protein